MANTDISDVAKLMKLGDNKTVSVELEANSNVGDALYYSDDGKVTPVPTDSDQVFAGINGGKYDETVDATISSGKVIEMIVEGYTAAITADPGATKYPATPLYAGSSADTSTAGAMSYSVPNGGADDYEPIEQSAPAAKLTKAVANGDTVALIKIQR
jgi:hypothetical protein